MFAPKHENDFKDKLIKAINLLPDEWALTPTQGKKSYRDGWQGEKPLSKVELVQIIQHGDRIPDQKNLIHPKGIGLRTGIVSGGLVAIDLDGRSARPYMLSYLSNSEELPKTVAWTSGRPGRSQHIYRMPEQYWSEIASKKFKTGAKGDDGKLEQVELRWNHLQSVLPPSEHPDTGQYCWLVGCAPWECDVAEAPQWMIEKMLKPAEPPNSKKTPHSKQHEPQSDIDRALSYLSALSPKRAEDYDDWLAVGMALHSVDDSLLREWDAWSAQSPKYKPGDCDRKWESFKRTGISIGSLAFMAKADGWKDQVQSNRFGGGGEGNPPVSNVSLRDRIEEILERTESQAERKSAFISLASSTKISLRELEQLSDLVESENELSDGRQERKKELDRLFKISARRLTLPRYLHSNLAHPFEKIASWMGVDVESLLTIMLPTSASLLNPQTRVVVKESIDFLEPLIVYAGIVSESGNRKSPIFKIVTKALRKLQNEEDARYNQAHLEYQEQLKAWKKTKPEERDESPEPPPPPREFYLDNFTSEALDKVKNQQPQHGILIRKDELSGLFNSYNTYRGGKGSDREGILSGWNGDGIKVNRANGSRLSLSQDASSIAGAIQPDKLRRIMGDLLDEQGEWARFLWFLAPVKAFRLPQGDTKFELGDLLEGIYRKLDRLPPTQYRFSPEGQQIYDDYHWLLERRKLAEPRQGMRSAIAKLQGYCARFAGLLHILWEVAAGQEPGETIPSDRVEAATALAEFYLGQVRLIHSDGEADSNELNPLLKKLLEKAKQLNGITARIAKQSIKALKGTTPQKVREYLNELVEMEYGVIEGEGSRSKFIPKTVDQTVDHAKNPETIVKSSFSPTDNSSCRPTVDQTVDLVKNSKSYVNKGIQPTVDSNCRPVDQILHSLENSVSNSTSTSTNSNVVSSNTLNDGLQVYTSAESFDDTSVEAVDPGSTVGSTVDSGSTVTDKTLDFTSVETVDPGSTAGSTADSESTLDFENPDYWDDETNGSGGSTVVDLKPKPGGGGADAIPAEEKSPDNVTTGDNRSERSLEIPDFDSFANTVGRVTTADNIYSEPKNQKLLASIESDRALVHLVEEDDKPRLLLDESKLDLYRERGFELKPWQPTLQVKSYEQMRRAIVDIETFGLNPDTDRIIAIGLKMGDQVAIVSDRNEAAMLKEFNNLLVKWQPDVLSGHNIMNFDCPFIAKRCALHGIKSPFRISDRESCLRATRVNGKPITYREVHVCDRKINLIDTYHLTALFDYSARQLSNLKLKSAVLELGLRKEARLELSAEEIKQDWTSGDFQTIEKYLKFDLEDTELLMDAFLPQIHYQALVVPGLSLQQMVLRGNGTKWQKVLQSYYGKSPDADIVPQCEGAARFAAKAGIFTNVASVDIASLYPSIQQRYGVCSAKDPDKYSLRVLQYLTAERLRLKKLGKSGDLEAKRQSDALKILLNSLTGMLGTNSIGFNDPVAFSLVTSYGRAILKLMARTVEECGGQVCFGDTDGLCFTAPNIPATYARIVDTLPDSIKLDPCEVWDALYIPSGKGEEGSKCTYIYWKNGEPKLKGGRYTNRDNPSYLREYEIGFLSTYSTNGLAAAQNFHDDFVARLSSGEFPIKQLSCRRIVQQNSKFKHLGEVGQKVRYWVGEGGTYTNEEPYDRNHYNHQIELLHWELLTTLGHEQPKPNKRKKKAKEPSLFQLDELR